MKTKIELSPKGVEALLKMSKTNERGECYSHHFELVRGKNMSGFPVWKCKLCPKQVSGS